MSPSVDAASNAAVTARSVTVTRGTVQALRATTFALAPGRCLAVTGPNGSGKTTLLALVSGHADPTTGEVEVLGVPAVRARRRHARDLSVLTGGFAYYPDLTVAEHLQLIAASWPTQDLRTSVEDALTAAGLLVVRDQLPEELSSGESQMFALACATMRPARVLVLDEPEQRLDATRRAQCIAVLSRVKHDGCAIVMATHSEQLREALADQTLTLQARDDA